MANVEFILSTVVRDIDGNTTPQQAYFDAADTITLAQLVTACKAYQVLFNAVIDPVIVECTAKAVIDLDPSLPAMPGPNPIIKGALFTYPKTGQLNRSWGQLAPGWAQGKTVNGKVDLTDTAVQNYYKNWGPNNITNLSSFLSNNWEGLQPAKRVKLNDRSHEREYNRNSIENIP